MTITIESTGVKLDIPVDTKLSIEMNSPIFSNAGSSSLPISLPLTSKNRHALSFPDRLDIYDSSNAIIRDIPDTPVIVSQGSLQLRGMLSVMSSTEESIEVTVYLNESNIWSILESLTLPQAMKAYRLNLPSRDQRAYISLLNAHMIYGAIQYDGTEYHTILTPEQEEMNMDRYESKSEWLSSREFVVAPLYTNDGWLNELSETDRGNIFEEEQLVSKYFKLKPSDTQMSPDTRYMTPLLRLDYVLKKVFESIGRELVIDFESWPDADEKMIAEQWQSVIVLNNTMDAYVLPESGNGYVPYSSLVPEISCKEFLNTVCSQFGAIFVEQSDLSVKMIFTNSILSACTGEKTIEYRNMQIGLNQDAGHSPSEGMGKIGDSDYGLYEMDATGDYSHPSSTAGRVPSFELGGYCQRTTISTSGGEDISKATECPLLFGVYNVFYAVENDLQHYIHYPYIGRNFYYDSHPGYERALNSTSARKTIFNDTNEVFQYLFGEKTDHVTITRTMQTTELASFDFTRPSVIQGRLCWPIKLQSELNNGSKQHVTLEFIAPRKKL